MSESDAFNHSTESQADESQEELFPPATDRLTQSSDWLVGVIDDPAAAEQAVEDLKSAGFKADDITLMHGDEAQDRLQQKEEHRGPLGAIVKAVSRVTTDSTSLQDVYEDEVQAGHSLVNVRMQSKEEMEPARQILARHEAHRIKYFGTWAVSDLS